MFHNQTVIAIVSPKSDREHNNRGITEYKKRLAYSVLSEHLINWVFFINSFRQSTAAMKILVACIFMSFFSLNLASPLSFSTSEHALLDTLVSAENDENAVSEEDSVDEDLAMLQGVLNVMEQADEERARMMDRDNIAAAQIWGLVGKGLWHVGKRYLKNRYCNSEEQEMQAILQELIGEQSEEEDESNTGEDDSKVLAELQTLFSALNKAEAKAMQGEMNAEIEGWFKKLKKWAKKKIGGAAKKYLC